MGILTALDAVRHATRLVDAMRLADELAGYGPEVRVLTPPLLQMAVRHRLLSVARVHGVRNE